MLYRILIALVVLLPTQLEAQSLTFKNGDLTKTFGPDTYYNMVFSDFTGECCYTAVDGYVQRIYADSIKIRVHQLRVNNQPLDFNFGLQGEIYEKDLSLTFPKADLTAIKAYKSKKQMKKKSSWNILGGMLIFTGIVTLANSYDLDDKRFRDGVLISSGAQLGVGIIGLSLSNKKEYKAADGWRF